MELKMFTERSAMDGKSNCFYWDSVQYVGFHEVVSLVDNAPLPDSEWIYDIYKEHNTHTSLRT